MSVIPQVPGWGLGELTTGELSRYRTALETALATAPEGSADRTVIQARLDGVTGEQTRRRKTTGLVPSGWTES